MINAILREMAIIAAVSEALGYEDLTDLGEMLTEDEGKRLVAIAESVEDTEENHIIAEEVGRAVIRESIDRLLALEVSEAGAETGD